MGDFTRMRTISGGDLGGHGKKGDDVVAPRSTGSGGKKRSGNWDTGWQPETRSNSAGDTGGEGGGGQGGGTGDTRTLGTKQGPAQSAKAGGVDLRQMFTGATLKRIIGLPSLMSDIIFGTVKNPSGGNVSSIAKDRSDVYVAFVDVISGIPGIGRLFAPGSAFWRLPRTGDSITVLKHSDADGPGVPYVLHGDGGSADAVPKWLSSGDSGTFVNENWHVEAAGDIIIKSASGAGSVSGNDSDLTTKIQLGQDGSIIITGGVGTNVEINSIGGGNIVLNAGALGVARLTDTVNGTAGPYPVQGVIAGPGALNVKA